MWVAMEDFMAKEITIATAGNYKVVRKGPKLIILETGEDLIQWYRNIVGQWFLAYPGYSMWTMQKFVDITNDILNNTNFGKIKFNTVREFIDFIDKKRMETK
jgi:hypothetical protein